MYATITVFSTCESNGYSGLGILSRCHIAKKDTHRVKSPKYPLKQRMSLYLILKTKSIVSTIFINVGF